MDLNHNLVKDLKNMNLWDKVKDQIIESQGDISGIEGIPAHTKEIYKTSFTTSPFAFIEVAARAQKWVDQALSRNMYLETRDIDETMKIYATAWEKGLKSTYYLHMKPRHTAEQSTTRVNKAEKMGQRGFAAVAKAAATEPAPVAEAIKSPAEMQPQIQPVIRTSPEKPYIAPSSRSFATVAVASTVPLKFGEAEQASATAPLAPAVSTGVVSDKKPLSAATHAFDHVKAALAEGHTKPKVHIAKNGPKVCPTDPAEKALCDSCQ